MRNGKAKVSSLEHADPLDDLEELDAAPARGRGRGLSAGLAFAGLLAASLALWLLMPGGYLRPTSKEERMAEVERLNDELVADSARLEELLVRIRASNSAADTATYDKLKKDVDEKVKRIWSLGGYPGGPR